MISAIGYLHEQDIIYRDLKPENLLIADDGHIKITDFGLARESITSTVGAEDGIPAQSIVGTPEYFAPELLTMEPYGKSADWWCVGILMFELMTGKSPFSQENEPPPIMFSKIKAGGMKSKIFQGSVAKRIHYPPEAMALILRFLDPNPHTRIGSDGLNEIKEHAFFSVYCAANIPNFSWDKVDNKELTPPWKPDNMRIQDNLDQGMNKRQAGTFANTAPMRGIGAHSQAILDGFEFDAY